VDKHYTYIHKKSDGTPFYVGKGIGNRAYDKYSRNPYWQNKVNKHGLNVEILAYWDTEVEAFDHEKLIILCFKDMGIKLTNMSDGGEGNSGCKWTDESKQKLSNSTKGNKAWLGKKHSTETIEKMRLAHTGHTYLKGKKHTEEHKANVSNAKKLWWAKKKGLINE
jgi:hypothetical protein